MGNVISFDNLIIDPTSRVLSRKDSIIPLTAKEFDLLYFFASNSKRVFSRSQLLKKIWGDELYTDPSTVTVHIHRLREKIEDDPSNPKYLQTVWGIGYKFVGETK
jgi:DNA-binding response OmpR family regulator